MLIGTRLWVIFTSWMTDKAFSALSQYSKLPVNSERYRNSSCSVAASAVLINRGEYSSGTPRLSARLTEGSGKPDGVSKAGTRRSARSIARSRYRSSEVKR